MELWTQIYNPFGNAVLSTLAAVIPICMLLGLIASGKVRVHIAAGIALTAAILIAAFVFTMP